MAKTLYGAFSQSLLSVAVNINRFMCFGSGAAIAAGTTEAQQASPIRRAGTFSNLSVYLNSNSMTLANVTIRSRINSANGNQVVVVAAGLTGHFTDSSNTDTTSPGNTVNINYVSDAAGVGSASFVSLWMNFSATVGHVSLQSTNSNSSFSTASSTRYFYPAGLFALNTTEADSKVRYDAGGTLNNMSLYVSSNARTSSTTFNSRVNEADGTLLISVGAAATGLFEDTSNADAVSNGDDVAMALTTGSGTGSIAFVSPKLEFVTTGHASDLYALQSTSRGGSATTHYMLIAGRNSTSNVTEADAAVRHRFDGSASMLKMYLSASTTASDVTVRFRKNAADGNQVLTIPAATTGLFQDTSNTDSFEDTDDVDLSIVGGTSGSMTMKYYGMLELAVFPNIADSLMVNQAVHRASRW